jgi:hypothetical protein
MFAKALVPPRSCSSSEKDEDFFARPIPEKAPDRLHASGKQAMNNREPYRRGSLVVATQLCPLLRSHGPKKWRAKERSRRPPFVVPEKIFGRGEVLSTLSSILQTRNIGMLVRKNRYIKMKEGGGLHRQAFASHCRAKRRNASVMTI